MRIHGSVLLVVCLSALLQGPYAYGQRNYATSQTSGKSLGAEIKDPEFPVRFPEIDDHSRLKVNGVHETAYQILHFPGLVSAYTPVTIRLRWKSDITLLGGLIVEPVKNGAPLSGASSQIPLLTLLSSRDEEEWTLVPSSDYDGIKITLSGGVLSSSEIEIYYAYYLDDPKFSVEDPVCAGGATQLQILNFQSGYRYNLYTAQSGGTPVEFTSTSTLKTPPVNVETTFYVEADEHSRGAGMSRRIPVTIRVRPKPVLAVIPDQHLCEGESLNLSSLNPPVQTGSTGGTYEWLTTDTGPALPSTTITPAAGTATYWVKYTADGCADLKTVTIVTAPKPNPITITLSTN
ncbi:MAG TPA: hypothetical protein VGE15_09940 [Sphingobacteriaceae bacterium]